ncbi:hypothetical protein [Agarivorans sp. 1_MG-2023]|uniref:hypothetical protein n=1 Tax=Agarivorans sp. 1_MG-2023 TaxID=3062634 RepID=UPI0026E458FD|nr:hypothetical protein [Agarivorans sp. 1_MG-2023]MDO6762840.1 hypothetical protein [Agarivorans sp. 1_MG-2023]
MIRVKNQNYKCYLIDSNFIIQMFKERESFGSNLINMVLSDGLFVFSPVSIWEISQDDCFDDFIATFSTLPSLLLSSEEEIITKEAQNYYSDALTSLEDVSVPLSSFSARSLKALIKSYVSKVSSKRYKANEKYAFSEIKNSKKIGYLCGQTISDKKAIRSSVELAAFEFIAKAAPTFCKDLQTSNTALNVNKFPSQVSKSYIYHYKFAHPTRKGESSDLSDILISSALPYVDVYLTENSLANSIREIKGAHGQFKHLETKTMKHMRIKQA